MVGDEAKETNDLYLSHHSTRCVDTAPPGAPAGAQPAAAARVLICLYSPSDTMPPTARWVPVRGCRGTRQTAAENNDGPSNSSNLCTILGIGLNAGILGGATAEILHVEDSHCSGYFVPIEVFG